VTSGQDNQITEAKPWERQRDEKGELESNLWFGRFWNFYLPQGSDRSLLAAYRAWRVQRGADGRDIRSVAKSWERAANKWNWKQRAEAWDEHNRQELEIEWEARRKQIKDREWKGAEKLLERAEKMLGYPLSEVIQEDKEGKIFKVQPVRWRQSDVTRFMEAASKLARLAAGMETETKHVDITSEGEQISGIAALTSEQLAAWLAATDARLAAIRGTGRDDPPGDPSGATEAGSTEED